MEQFVSTFSASGRPPKATCRQCRFRKVRCDGVYGDKGCGDCKRLKFDCSFVFTTADSGTRSKPPTLTPPTALPRTSTAQSTAPDSGDARVVERRRTSKACTHCRQQKVRCSGGAPCLACKKKAIVCAYGTDRRRGSRVAASGAGDGGDDGLEGSSSMADDDTASTTSPTTPPVVPVTHTHTLVDFFFTSVYPLPSYSFLHPQTTLTQAQQGTLDPCLAHAISAVASHFKHHHREAELETSWIEAAEALIWKHLESPTMARLQALLLVVLYRVETGTFQRAFMLSSLAARAAAAMRLNYERTSTTATDREVRRRVMWSLKLVERYFSMGIPEFELCPVENVYLDLPCSEDAFQLETTTTTTPSQQEISDHGAYHLCVKLEMLRRDIMKLTRSLSVHDAPFPPLPAVLHDFEQHLARIAHALPPLQLLLPTTPWLARHVLVQLSFHQCHCDLYRLLLRDYREAAPAVVLDALDAQLRARAEALCLQHATAMVDILATLNSNSQQYAAVPFPRLEYDTAICGYHATRVLLFLATSRRTTSVVVREEWALSRAELCLANLRRFFPASRLARPVLDEMQRAISSFASRSSSASPVPVAGARDANAGLSAAARVRQRLAIHSLLRQADFGDEAEEEAVPTYTPTSPGFSDSSAPPLSPDTAWQVPWFGSTDFGATERWDADLVANGFNSAVGPLSPMTFPWLQRWEGASAVRSETI